VRPKPREGLEPDDRFNTDFPVTRILPAYARQDLYLNSTMSIEDRVPTALVTPGSHIPSGCAFG